MVMADYSMMDRWPPKAVEIYYHRINFHLMGLKFFSDQEEKYSVGAFDQAFKRTILEDNELLIGILCRPNEQYQTLIYDF